MDNMFLSRNQLIGLIVIFILTENFAQAMSPSTKLGAVLFPTSGVGQAQQHFLRGFDIYMTAIRKKKPVKAWSIVNAII